jgi:hypothetical protein
VGSARQSYPPRRARNHQRSVFLFGILLCRFFRGQARTIPMLSPRTQTSAWSSIVRGFVRKK